MSTILSIKRRCNDGDSVARIAREEGVSEPTVRKYRDMDDLSPCVKAPKRRASKLDPFKPIVDAWLAEDARRRPKQRHTARRVYDRLVAECGYDGGYTTVQKYVKARKAEIRSVKGEFLNLEWQLFVEDQVAMAALPAKPFRAVRIDSAKTDKYGDACLEGKHRYPLGPEHGEERVTVELGAFRVAFYGHEGSEIASFDRAYDDAPDLGIYDAVFAREA